MVKYSRLLSYIVLAAVMLLSACSLFGGSDSVEGTPTVAESGSSAGSDVPTQPPTEAPVSAYPSPGSESGFSYPLPGSEFGSTYPGPGQGPDAGSSIGPYPGPYPGPGDAYPPPPTQPAEDPYPAPATETPSNAYPGPGDPYPPPDQSGTPGATTTPGTQVPTPSPTPTLTPLPTATPFPTAIPFDARMRATDPRTVELASGEYQFIEFFAFWCGYCKAMAPMVHELEARYGEEINFIYLDIDDPATKELKLQLGYELQPHYFLLDGNGFILGEWLGLVEAEEFERVFQEILE